jgi:hypothetical protein
MVLYSYFDNKTPPKPMRRKNRRYNDLDPKDKGKNRYKNDYGIDHVNND